MYLFFCVKFLNYLFSFIYYFIIYLNKIIFNIFLILIRSSKVSRGDCDDGDDDAIEAEGRPEDLHDEHLHKEGVSLGVAEGRTRPGDADGDAAEEVAEARGEAGAEEAEAGSVVGGVVAELGVLDGLCLHLEDDGDDDTVDGYGLAEENADQMLGTVGSLDGGAEDTCPSDINTPIK